MLYLLDYALDSDAPDLADAREQIFASAKATGSSYTAVNRRLSEGRARLRALERERDAEQGDADER